MTKRTVDLHVHPWGCWSFDQAASGGPPETVGDWLTLGSDLFFAITDHNTVVSYEALQNEIKLRRLEGIIELMPGVEVNSVYRGSSNHILGYWIQQPGESVLDILGFMKMASSDILIAANDAEYWKYAHPGRENVQEWRRWKQSDIGDEDDSDKLTLSLLEAVRDGREPRYSPRAWVNTADWTISPISRPGKSTLVGLTHTHLAEAMKKLKWVDSAKQAQDALLRRGRPLYPCTANGNDLSSIEESVSSEKVVEGLYKSRALVVFAHPHELIRIRAEEEIVSSLGYKHDYSGTFTSKEGTEYTNLSQVLIADRRCRDIINQLAGEVWDLIKSLTAYGLRGVELYNRYSYVDEAMEFVTQKFEMWIRDYNHEHLNAPLIATAGTDSHKGTQDKEFPFGMITRQRTINRLWWARSHYMEKPDDTPFNLRKELLPIEENVIQAMREAGIDPKTDLYLLPS
jgi:hypothetical protein